MEMYNTFVKLLFCDNGFSHNDCGRAVLIGKYLITVGHNFDENKYLYFYQNAKRYYLYEKDALYIKAKPNYGKGDLDLAVFLFDEIDSCLKFPTKSPDISDELSVVRLRGNLEKRLDLVKCTLEELESPYFLCSTNSLLYPGDSGSPIVDGDVVYGLLVGNPTKLSSDKIVFISLYDVVKNILN